MISTARQIVIFVLFIFSLLKRMILWVAVILQQQYYYDVLAAVCQEKYSGKILPNTTVFMSLERKDAKVKFSAVDVSSANYGWRMRRTVEMEHLVKGFGSRFSESAA